MADEKSTRREKSDEQKSNTGLPSASLEQGAAASTFVDNPDKPDPTSVAQVEKLPDEK